MRWPLRSRHHALVAGALLGALSVVPSAVAQQPTQVEFSTFRLFERDSVDLNRGDFQRLASTIRNAQTPSSCPVGRLKIRVPEGDPLFQQALAAARRDAVLATLEQLGLRVAGRLFVETEMFGGPEGHDTVYESPSDRTPPTLRTTSNPPKGSKVQPGQRIVVQMVARDDADRWQTGIKTIQLVAESDGGRDLAPTPVHYGVCSDPNEKRVEAIYVVPPDPPPIVRLKATATDHANQSDFDIGEFPTGDFYGTLTYPAGQPPHQHMIRADLILNHDGRGNLTGTMVGQTNWIDASTAPGCFTSQVRPHRFRVALVGSYTEGRSIKVFIGDIEDTPMILNNRCPTYNTTDPVPQLGFKNYVGLGWYPQQPFLGTPSVLGDGEILPDGTRVYKHINVTGTMTVTLRRARN